MDGPQWESGNRAVSATARQLVDWAAGRPGKRRLSQDSPSPLSAFRPDTHWAYYAYKHIPLEFGESPHTAEKLVRRVLCGLRWEMWRAALGF